jgi:transposase
MENGVTAVAGPKHPKGRTAMEYHAGIDVSLELSSICIADATGKFIKEARVISDHAALVAFFDWLGFAAGHYTLEAMTRS